eukprot:CAMPEP_0114559300 /NCGR_PEP_ID=MMETSP0114-20121206/10849_1 /TAXON_ID=31324 /ORGANISM="Goniomonas sp, Strain m" /LENGTH=235 /DNA_ID=CAMNT_0001744763 /DNA_START=28 /DNA_END=735 /DNA_ORIENTATION=-
MQLSDVYSFALEQYGVPEPVTTFLLGFAFLAVVDVIFRLCNLGGKAYVRWYYVHAVGNAVIVAVSWTRVVAFVQAPLSNMSEPFHSSAAIIAALHLYHLLTYKCVIADVVHHLAFVGIGTAVQVVWGSGIGSLSGFYHFFICGVPGGIDYLLLGLVGSGRIEKRTRIAYAVELNSFLRSPGLTASATFAYIWYSQTQKTWLDLLGLVLMGFVSMFNGQYYMRQVCLAAGNKYKIE